MKSTGKLTVLLLLIILLLFGCNSPPRVFTCQDLSISLPVSFTDLSGSEDTSGLDFFYLSSKMGITGHREEKSGLAEAARTAEGYVNRMKAANSHPGEAAVRNDIYSYTYTAQTDGETYTYLVAAFDANDGIWLLQCYCKTADFPKLERDMWSYLETVTFS